MKVRSAITHTKTVTLLRERYAIALYVGLIHAQHVQVQPEDTAPDPVVAPVVMSTPTPTTTVKPTSSPWSCIAAAETGTDWHMVGETYSTAFGLVNDIIRDYGTPEEQQAVFSGTASPAEQVDIASRFAADHGFSGWGFLTRSKCNL